MKHDTAISTFSLFTSSATLLCCALPATLSVVAGAAAVTSMISIFPWLIPLSKYKLWIFIIAGVALSINAYLLYRQGKVCPVASKEACEKASKISKIIFWISTVIFLIGVFFAYGLTPILYAVGVFE